MTTAASSLEAQQCHAEAITNKYETCGVVGHGAFGLIQKVKRKSDGYILCRKEIQYAKMQPKEREQLQTEVNILKSLRHPNIVSYFDTVHIADKSTLHLYMEYCGGGDLGKVIQELADQNSTASEMYVWSVAAQLAEALYRCHYGIDVPLLSDDIFQKPKDMPLRSKSSTTILHRDLKPENVFLSDQCSVKLGDFGLSKQIQGGGFAHTYVGTPYYMCPEICNGERYTLKSDIWSVGCILYELCTTRPPFDARTHSDLANKIRRGLFRSIGDSYSKDLRSLIDSCLQVNPISRPATNEIIDHPMIRLLRKQADLDRAKKAIKTEKDLAIQIRNEAEAFAKSCHEDRKNLEKERRELDAKLHREWECKASLKIQEEVTRRTAEAQAELHARWEDQFPKAVAVAVASEVERRIKEWQEEWQAAHEQRPEPPIRSTSPDTAPKTSPIESIHSLATDDCTTDLSALTVDSPFQNQNVRVKRNSRTPFTRAKAQTAVDSPADIHMIGQSPAVNRLTLSPRRKAPQAGETWLAKNLAAADKRWQAMNLSDLDSDTVRLSEAAEMSDSEDEVAPLPSPTETRGKPIFIWPDTSWKRRPSLGRQQTMPAHRWADQKHLEPVLFVKDKRSISDHSPPSTSPTRERRAGGGLKMARTDGNMFREIAEREACRTAPGRALSELHKGQLYGHCQETIVSQSPIVLRTKDTNLPLRGCQGPNFTHQKCTKTYVGTSHHADLYRDVPDWYGCDPKDLPSPFKRKTDLSIQNMVR